jgi:uncharacterized protein
LHALPVDTMPMTLSVLDGYVTGVLACTEMIPPSEWMPGVWGETETAEFPDEKTATDTVGSVMAHYNDIAEAMIRSPWIEPIYEIDPNSDEILREPWVDGFTRAPGLRPDAWERLLDRPDQETRTTMVFLTALQEIYMGQSKFSGDETGAIDIEVPDLIPNSVATILHQSRPELYHEDPAHPPHAPFSAGPRSGRSAPCTCGSGRKYKQCCART